MVKFYSLSKATKRKIGILLILLCTAILMAKADEVLYTVPISDDYYAKVFQEDNESVSSPGWIAVYSKKTNKELIKVNSDDLYIDIGDDGNISVNVLELPYGSQSVIIYDDFNFDGIKDIALRNGNMSCYGGPSYEVYLADGKGNFKHSSGFTDLAQGYCGFFSVDYDKKLIHTMTKSGCCSHWFYTFKVVNNQPQLIEEIEETLSFSIPFILKNTVTKWKGKAKNEYTQDLLLTEENGVKEIFSFRLKNKDRKVMLLADDKKLYYAFIKYNLQKDPVVEFYYPISTDEDVKEFYTLKYSKLNNNTEETITFVNEQAQYQLYNSNDKVGIRVTTKGKVYDMPGEVTSRNANHFFDLAKDVDFYNLELDTNYPSKLQTK